MVRGDNCSGVSPSTVILWCFVMETSLQIGSGSRVFESSPEENHKANYKKVKV